MNLIDLLESDQEVYYEWGKNRGTIGKVLKVFPDSGRAKILLSTKNGAVERTVFVKKLRPEIPYLGKLGKFHRERMKGKLLE